MLAATGAALHPAVQHVRSGSPVRLADRSGRIRVLFVCTGNSARSPIAEALLRNRTGGAVDVTSAGSRPREQIHPSAVRVLRDEYGIDIAGQRPRHLDMTSRWRFDYVVTLCDRVREVCPGFPGHPRHIHWSIRDPAPAGAQDAVAEAVVRRTAHDIDARIGHLLHVLATTRQTEVRA